MSKRTISTTEKTTTENLTEQEKMGATPLEVVQKNLDAQDRIKNQQERIPSVVPIQRPSPSCEPIFIKHMATPHVNVRRSVADESKQIFQFEDVLHTVHPLARLMRMILVDAKMTHAEFDEKHRIYAESAGFFNVQINYNRNNVKKAMFREKLSWSMFEQIIMIILGYEMVNFSIDLVHPDTGEMVTYSLSSIQDLARQVYEETMKKYPESFKFSSQETK